MYYSKCQELSAFVNLMVFIFSDHLNAFTRAFLELWWYWGSKSANGQAQWAKRQTEKVFPFFLKNAVKLNRQGSPCLFHCSNKPGVIFSSFS